MASCAARTRPSWGTEQSRGIYESPGFYGTQMFLKERGGSTMKKSMPWPLAAAIVLIIILSLAQILFAFSGIVQILRFGPQSVFNLLVTGVPVCINIVLIIGLVLRWRWARWLTIIRCGLGIIWNFADIIKLNDIMGGYMTQESLMSLLVIAGTMALCTAIIVFLLFPSVGSAFEPTFEPGGAGDRY